MKIHFLSNDRIETIIKASNNRLYGKIKTDANIYSADFIYRWIDFGFIKTSND